jgi:hypothetical protein
MITFVPFPSYEKSARVLDRQRLCSQRREGCGLLNGITKSKVGDHPGKLPVMWQMWWYHPEALAVYIRTIDEEWQRRGYQTYKIIPAVTLALEKVGLDKSVMYKSQSELEVEGLMTIWHNNEDFHRSHRLKLAWKKWEYYEGKFDDVKSMPVEEPIYIWPTPKWCRENITRERV